VEGISSDMQNTVISSLLQAIDLGGLANRELVKTLSMRFQSGTITISNKGVITGCTIEKSTSATRNINLKEGTIFVGGMLVPISEETNGAAIPSNYSGLDKICYIYLGLGSRGWEAFCTDLGGSIPDNGVPLYRITVPAGSTEAVDPYLENIILTDIRRIEPNAPKTFLNAPFVYVALPFNVLGNDYSVDLDVIDFDGGGYQLGYIYADERASNGFKVCANGMADNIEIRWTIRKLNL